MTTPPESESAAVFAATLARWLDHAGVQNTAAAVDLADVLYAAKQVEGAVQSLMRLRPGDRTHAAQAVDELGKLHAWLFTEMKPHLAELEAAWPSIEAPVIGLLPDDSSGSDRPA